MTKAQNKAKQRGGRGAARNIPAKAGKKPSAAQANTPERIQKLLSRAGYGSRREVERWIEAGELTVNGQPAQLGQPVSGNERIMLRGQLLRLSSRLNMTHKVLLYHKKAGEICTRHDPEGRTTVFSQLPKLSQGRWVAVGRLDLNTDGLLLFTTDGELANKLMHPSSETEREYACRILGNVDNDMLQRLQQGVTLDDGEAKFLDIKDAGGEGANHWYHVILAEGRNREVRRLWESQGVQVSRLIRVRYGIVPLPRYLRAGYYELMDVRKMRKLYESAGLEFAEGGAEAEDVTGKTSGKENPWHKNSRANPAGYSGKARKKPFRK